MKIAARWVVLVSLLVGSLVVSRTVAVPAGDIAKATQTTTVLANALVAAVVSISDATPAGSSAADIDANSEAVSILVLECQGAYRLIDASGSPIDPTNVPNGAFEVNAMADLVNGAPVVQQPVGRHLRTLVPLTSDMHPNCVTCHTIYGGLPPGSVVGAAAFKIRL